MSPRERRHWFWVGFSEACGWMIGPAIIAFLFILYIISQE